MVVGDGVVGLQRSEYVQVCRAHFGSLSSGNDDSDADTRVRSSSACRWLLARAKNVRAGRGRLAALLLLLLLAVVAIEETRDYTYVSQALKEGRCSTPRQWSDTYNMAVL